jgi:hypothetical protein
MKVYMLTIYIIHVECDDSMLSHHMWLYATYNFIYVANKILVVHFVCNLFLVASYNHKLDYCKPNYYAKLLHAL